MNAVVAPQLSIEAFEAADIDGDDFNHEGHIYVAWLYLNRYSLADALARFTCALQHLTVELGVPEKYHATVSWLMMLLIAERRSGDNDWPSFRRRNDDLFVDALTILRRYYTEDLLWSDRARTSFVLPDRC